MVNAVEFCEGRACPWRVRWSELGKRRHKYFDSEKKAEGFAKALVREREKWGRAAITDAERVMVMRLREWGGVDAVMRWVEVGRASERGAVMVSVPVEEAIEAYRGHGARQGWSQKHALNVRCALDRLLAAAGNVQVGELGGVWLRDYVVGGWQGESSRRQMRSIIAAWWRWCAGRGWCVAEVVGAITWEARRELVGRRPAWSRGEVDRFLDACEPGILPGWVLRFGAGIRAEEVARMRWEDARGAAWYGVDRKRKEIHMAPEWTKGGRYRMAYDLPGWVWERLEGCEAEDAWIVPGRYRDRDQVVYRQRWRLAVRRALRKAGLPAMPQNLARHTFASHAYHRGLEWAMEVMGHQEGSRMFHSHYKGNVTRDESGLYWG